jgi:hypothetical protein
MAGEALSKRERALWSQSERRGGLAAMTDADLRHWADVCRRLSAAADQPPTRATKARRHWRRRQAEAERLLSEREASRGMVE